MHELKENTKTSIKTEIALMLLGPYASYLVATGLNLSGICAILMNGVFLSSFGTPNLQPASKKIIKMIYEVLAYSTETLVFLFLGIGLVVFDHPFQECGWGTIFTTILNLNVARFLNIFICTWIVNRYRTPET